MDHIWRNRICFIATLSWLLAYWVAAGIGSTGVATLLIAAFGCTLMYVHTNRRLLHFDEQHRLLDQIIQNLPGAVFWKDAESRYRGCNGYFARFAGYESPDDLIDRTEFDLRWKKSEAKRYHLSDLHVMQTREPVVNLELSYTTKEGVRTTLLANKVPLLNEKGDVTGVLGMFQDISAQKEMERELADAKKLESLGQLSAGVAHEINTPMQCIMLNIGFIKDSYNRLSNVVDLLTESASAADAQVSSRISKVMHENRFEYCRKQIPLAIAEADEASRRVVEVVAAMKYLAHPNRDQVHPLDINLLIQNAITISRNSWKGTASIDFDFDNSLPRVPGLQGALTQVLINLVGNACDAIESANRAEAGQITIRTRAAKHGVQIDVQDNGTGIPENILSRVFDPFFTTKEVGKGTGQGLAISHDVIINRHKGRISIASQVGAGTTFSVWLPAEPQEPAREMQAALPEALNLGSISLAVTANLR